MKLRKISNNATEITTSDGAVILYSYATPVAAQLAEGGFIRTSHKWSKTTSKHITQWLDGRKCAEVDQSTLNAMVRVAS